MTRSKPIAIPAVALATVAVHVVLCGTSCAVAASASSASAAASTSGRTIIDSSWRRGVPPSAWNTVLQASGRLALMDLHDLYVRDASQLLLKMPSFRGGAAASCGSGGDNNVDQRQQQPHMSVSTAWSELPRPSQSATKAAIDDDRIASSSVSPPSVSSADHSSVSFGSKSPVSSSTLTSTSLLSASPLARTLATIWSSWNILNGALLTFAPKDSYDMAAYLVEAIGVVRISHGLQLFLSTVANVPSKTSMGVAILPRLIFLVTCMATKTYDKIGGQSTGNSMVLISAGIMSATAVALLSDKGRPNLMANIFSTMTFAKGCGMMFRPDRVAAKLFGFAGDAAADLGKVPAKVRSLGFHLIVSSVFTNALTHGLNPIRAAGYSSVAWFLLLVDLTFVVSGYRSLSTIPRTYLFFLASALACSAVFLTDAGRSAKVCELALGKEGGEGQQMVWEHGANVPLRFDEEQSADAGYELVEVEEEEEEEEEGVDGDDTSSEDFSSEDAYASSPQ